jgi:hypothetical protein
MIVVPFKREHLKSLVVQQRQRHLAEMLTDEVMVAIENSMSFSAMDGDDVLICCGMMEVAPGRALAWAYLSDNVGTRLVSVSRAIRRYMRIASYRRIEMDVDCEFPQAHRWAKLLGFEMECERRRSFTPDGRDCALYARIAA